MARPLHVQRAVLVWTFVTVLTGTCLGAEPVTETPSMESVDDLLASWLRMFGALITVLAIFFGGVMIFRKYGGLLQNKNAQGHLKILECRALNQRNALYVVDYQGERFLVTSGQQGTPAVTPLKETVAASMPSQEGNQVSKKDDFEGEIRKAMHAST